MCDLCKSKAEEYRVHDDDDRRSISSFSPSLRHSQSKDPPIVESSPSPLTHAKSPFAASQLFASNTYLHDALSAIEEATPSLRGESGFMSRPMTPPVFEEQGSDEDISRPSTAAPFRHHLKDDDRAADRPNEHTAEGDDPENKARNDLPRPSLDTLNGHFQAAEELRHRFDSRPHHLHFPRTETISTEGAESRLVLSRMDSNLPFGLRTRISSRASQGGLLGAYGMDDAAGLFRARTNSFR